MKILVTGGAGYIGSHVCKILSLNGFLPITYDNLSRGNRWSVKWGPLEVGDLINKTQLINVISKYKPIAVMHFAAMSYVGESIKNPELYYSNNVNGSINLLNVMKMYNILNFVFSSSCSTYGIPKIVPINENMSQNPISPYGASKLIVERMLKDYYRAYNINSISLRYFNAAGADSDCEIGEVHEPETHIIPNLLDVVIGRKEFFEVYGNDHKTRDGYCIRDYIHVEDLARAHILALEFLLKNNLGAHSYNLGTGKGYSVFEVIKITEQVTGKKIKYIIKDKKEGDPPKLIADVLGAKKILKWNPIKPTLNEQVKDAWKWHQKYYS